MFFIDFLKLDLNHYKKTLDFLGKYSLENTPISSENTNFREITEETSYRKFWIYSYEFSEEILRKYCFRGNYRGKFGRKAFCRLSPLTHAFRLNFPRKQLYLKTKIKSKF